MQFNEAFTGTGDLHRSNYTESGAAGLWLQDEHGELIGDLACNVGRQAGVNDVAIKNWSENENVLTSLIEQKIVRDTGIRISSGFVQVPICEIIHAALRE